MVKPWLHKMIWSYIPVFFIIFSILFFLFFQTILNQNRQNTIKSSEVFSRQLIQSIDISLKSIDHRVIGEMLNNALINEFFEEPDDHNTYLNYQMSQLLLGLKKSSPLIDSIYIKRDKDNLIFNGNLIKSSDPFEDSLFIRQMENSTNLSQWTDYRRYREYPFQSYKNVVSLVRKISSAEGSKGIFVININVTSIMAMSKRLYNADNTVVNLYDRKGNPLFEQGSVSRDSVMLSSHTSEYTGFKIESGLIDGKLIHTVPIFSGSWLLLGLLVFILGIVGIVYVSRKNYKPLDDLISRVHACSREEPKLGVIAVNEFKFIESAMDNFIGKSKRLEKQVEDIALLKKRYFFQELVSSSPVINIHQQLEGFVSPADPAHHLVFIIEIDHYEQLFKTYKKQDQELLKFVLSSVTHEMLSCGTFHVGSEWTTSCQMTGIIFTKGAASDIHSLCENVIQWVGSNLKFTVTFGISDPSSNREDIVIGYKQASEALQFKAAFGNNRVIPFSQTSCRSGSDPQSHLRAIHKMVEAFKGSGDTWEKDFMAVFDGFKACCLSRDEISTQIRYLIYFLDLKLSHPSKAYEDLWRNDISAVMQQSAEQFETLEELKGAFLSALQRYNGQLAELRECRNYHSIMKEVRSYMEKHYANPDLSLDFIGEKFGINAKYLSQLFKEQFGENFLDYLSTIRIEHAKKLLITRNDSIQTIGEKVGYKNAITFRRVIQRLEGLSPGDFRKQYKS